MDTTILPPLILAILGPTNTGKTHFAIERMLGHGSGMIGFPLRLLARENYDRVVRLKGRAAVALVTGEEKIVPPRARYFLCTVESMPLDRPTNFLAIDEVQLAADPERGHVFTDRLLHARGLAETILIGAETIAPLLRRLVPEAEFRARPRLSTLRYAGFKKITRLPPRSAVVGFTAAGVYELAELLRRRRGGTAVVLGALSPRTRNAQVAMYQAGEVDYLVATDAIGMGLNMDIDHVAFSSVVKFDGRRHRALEPAELAQIAGRAGRHMNDGSFGATAGLGGLDQEIVEAIENHRFRPLKTLYWRNADLDFSSPASLLRSLSAPPPRRELVRARNADDQLALAALAGDEEIAKRTKGIPGVRLLWEVCQIPDFRKVLAESHTGLLKRIYGFLTDPQARLPADWVGKQIARADRTEGNIETLTGRIADIRTWTYVSHRVDWLEDAAHWQARARAIEDRLSDALHERLTQRFVDQRAAVLVRKLADKAELLGAVNSKGEVLVEGQFIGRLHGFRFLPDETAVREDGRALMAAANRALRQDIAGRIARLETETSGTLQIEEDGTISWAGAPVARLAAGTGRLEPKIEPLISELLDPGSRERIRACLDRWLKSRIERVLAPLPGLTDQARTGAVRGLAYQLTESLGTLPRRVVASAIDALKPAERKALAAMGVRIGQETVFIPALQKPPAIRLRRTLWAVHAGKKPLEFDPSTLVLPAEKSVPAAYYLACGYRLTDGLAVRAERLEKLANAARKLARQGDFAATPALAIVGGCRTEELGALLAGLGYRAKKDALGVSFHRAPKRGRGKGVKKPPRAGNNRRPSAPDGPFAVLRDLVPPK
ncbi:MAG: helicase-related protein [Alphaproteobacteria bacterium]|nr:helicase-related protein [Alphaproteobacteria bacterium]